MIASVRWNIASVFASPAEADAAIVAARERIAALTAFRGTLTAGATLAAFLAARDEAERLVGRIVNFATMWSSTDMEDDAASGCWQKAMSLRSAFASAMSFAEPELDVRGEDELRGWVATTPALARRERWLELHLRERPHRRSAEVEELLADVAEPFAAPGLIAELLTESELELGVPMAAVSTLLSSVDPGERQRAYVAADGLHAVRNTLVAAYGASIRQSVVVARARRYPSTLAAALEPDEVPVEIHASTLAAVTANTGSWHRHWRARRARAGGTLHVADLRAPLTGNPPAITYDEGCDLVIGGFDALGEEIADAVRRGLREDGWVDADPRPGKVGGGYSCGCQGIHPFILLNWSDDTHGLGVLAHEVGHSLHSLLTFRAQPWHHADYSLFLAEVASNLGQILVREHVLRSDPSPDLELAILDEAFTTLHRYLFTMPTLARLEHELHSAVWSGGAVTADAVVDRCAALFAEGFGGEVAFEHDRVGMFWASYTHLYADYYPFQYTTGIAAAYALAGPILAGDTDAVGRCVELLSAGNSRPPLELLEAAGVDLRSPEPVNAAFRALDRITDRIAVTPLGPFAAGTRDRRGP